MKYHPTSTETTPFTVKDVKLAAVIELNGKPLTELAKAKMLENLKRLVLEKKAVVNKKLK